MKDDLFLTAIIPPSHVTAVIAEYQHRLFRDYGAVSGLFCVPHIPLFFSRRPPEGLFTDLPAPDSAYSTTKLHRVDDTVYLGVEPAGFWEQLRGQWVGQVVEGPYTPFPGIFLHTRPLEPEGRQETPEFPEPRRISWSSSTLVCLHMEFLFEGGGFRGCIIETMQSRRIKKAPRRSG